MKCCYMDIAHPNAKGTGAELRIKLIPADELSLGGLRVRLSPQRPSGFDRQDGVANTFDLTPLEVAEVLMVLRGHTEDLRDFKGIFKRDAETGICRVFKFSHRYEPLPGYCMSVSESVKDGEPREIHILLNVAEGIAIEAALSGGMKEMMFG